MINSKKKGFTIVELVIVIAVVAILAAVLIPTFSSLVRKANLAADQQAVAQMNKALAIADAEDDLETYQDAVEALDVAGYNSKSKLTPVSKGLFFFYLIEKDVVVLVDISTTTIVYPLNIEGVSGESYTSFLPNAKNLIWGLDRATVNNEEQLIKYLSNDSTTNITVTGNITINESVIIDKELELTIILDNSELKFNEILTVNSYCTIYGDGTIISNGIIITDGKLTVNKTGYTPTNVKISNASGNNTIFTLEQEGELEVYENITLNGNSYSKDSIAQINAYVDGTGLISENIHLSSSTYGEIYGIRFKFN